MAAPAINLSDSPRFAATLPRSYDAEGAPRQPLPLVQDGVAHRVVEAGTGHAAGAGGVGGTVPDHLVLVGGGAADVSELAAPVERGLFIPALSLHGGWVIGRRGSALAEGVRVIRGGEPAEPVANLTVLFEPLELLVARPGAQRPPAHGPVAAAALGAHGVGDRRPLRPGGRRAARRRPRLISRPSWPGRAVPSTGFSAFGFGARIFSTFTFGAFSTFGFTAGLRAGGPSRPSASDPAPGRAARPSASGPVPLAAARPPVVAPFPRSPLSFGPSCLPRRRLASCRP